MKAEKQSQYSKSPDLIRESEIIYLNNDLTK